MSALAEIAQAIERATPASERDRVLLVEGHDLIAGERTLSVKDVAELLGVRSPTTVRNWLERGFFQGVERTAGGHRRFQLVDVLAVKARMDQTRVENGAGTVQIPDFGDGDPYERPS